MSGGVVLVTGSAGAIGSATVQLMADAGYAVVGFDRAAPEGASHRHIEVELTDDRAIAEAAAAARGMGPLLHVISIAGGALPGEPETQDDPAAVDPALFRASIEANLTSQFLLLRAVLPWLRESAGKDRSVTLTSSFNALSGQGMPAYSAAKAGLSGIMYALVGPLGREGIRINVVAPGTIRTPRTEELWSNRHGHFERLERSAALGRLGEAADVAESFLALTRLRHVTGQILLVDGGQTVLHR